MQCTGLSSTSTQSTTQTTKKYTTPSKKSTQTTTASSTTSQTTNTQIADGYVPSSQTQVKGLYTKPQKLTDKQIEALNEAQAESKKNMIKLFTQSLFEGQSGHAKVASSSSLALEKLISTCTDNQFNLPALATTPEAAEAALTGDGAYSINSVATRILDMATSFAGDDPEKLETMRQAVEKGFEQAGLTFTEITKESRLPQICQDTYAEIMKRFDTLQKKYQSDDTSSQEVTSKDISLTEAV